MPERLRVFVHAEDPILEAGIAALFRLAPAVSVTDEIADASVVVVVAEAIDIATTRVLQQVAATGGARIVVIAARLEEADLVAGIEAGACAFVRRNEARPDRLVAAVEAAAAGDGAVPADLLGSLLARWSHLRDHQQPGRGLRLSGFTDRELQVLRLVAEGHETAEIARRLCYSERTVKAVIHQVVTRFQLRNRAQAVAYAVRQGVI